MLASREVGISARKRGRFPVLDQPLPFVYHTDRRQPFFLSIARRLGTASTPYWGVQRGTRLDKFRSGERPARPSTAGLGRRPLCRGHRRSRVLHLSSPAQAVHGERLAAV